MNNSSRRTPLLRIALRRQRQMCIRDRLYAAEVSIIRYPMRNALQMELDSSQFQILRIIRL